jgi:hypothetical protein
VKSRHQSQQEDRRQHHLQNHPYNLLADKKTERSQLARQTRNQTQKTHHPERTPHYHPQTSHLGSCAAEQLATDLKMAADRLTLSTAPQARAAALTMLGAAAGRSTSHSCVSAQTLPVLFRNHIPCLFLAATVTHQRGGSPMMQLSRWRWRSYPKKMPQDDSWSD